MHRFEKVSNIVKAFKLACAREGAQFGGLRVGNSTFTVFIEGFTPNTYLMLVTSLRPRRGELLQGNPGDAPPEEATLLNVALARPRFTRLIAEI